ncbi:MAG: nucleoside hydrolase [Armatimonadetes bacterium]|nr:nucleoside hydrolase [Armatimonadota bacterium]
MAIPIILDTDIGDDVDDAYCLTLAARWADVDLVAVTCCWRGTLLRAKLAKKLLDDIGASDVPVYASNHLIHRSPQLDWAADYPYEPPSETAAEAIVRLANERPGELTLVTIGPLDNLRKAVELDPHLGKKLKRVVSMVGRVGPNPDNPELEYNARCDPTGTRTLFNLGTELIVGNFDVTSRARLTDPWMSRLKQAGKPWTDNLVKLTELWGHGVPVLYDPMALSLLTNPFCQLEPARIQVDEEGRTIPVEGEPNCLMTADANVEGFLDWLVKTISE